MALDLDRRVVVCDLYGCWNELAVPSGRDHAEYVEEHPEWHYCEGDHRCPEHPFALLAGRSPVVRSS